MTAILWGIATAACWAFSVFFSSRSTRMIGQWSVLAWIMLVGLVASLPFASGSGTPSGLTPGAAGWLMLAALGNVFGLLVSFVALRIGKVGVVAPVTSAEGAVAAVVAFLFGESMGWQVGVCLAVITLGVVVSARAPDPMPLEHEQPARAVLLAALAACMFGASLFALGRVSGDLPSSWLVLAPRVLGVLVIALPLIVGRRIRLTRKALPFVVGSGVAEVLGFFAFAQGARESTAVTAVLASQFAPLAAVLAYLVYRERLGRQQLIGVAVLVLGVSALSLVTAR